jgi:hypothetical protein
VGGVRCGRGVLALPDGRAWVGLWQRDAPAGTGVLRFPDGREAKARWVDGKLVTG